MLDKRDVKIIHIIDDFGWGGVNSFVYDLCEELCIQGMDVSLIGIISKGEEQNLQLNNLKNHGVNVIGLGAEDKKDALIHHIMDLHKIFTQLSLCHRKIICNMHLKLSVLMGCLASIGGKNICLVETYHSEYHHYFMQVTLLRHFIKKYVCVSESATTEFRKRFRFKGDNVCTIPNGVNLKKLCQEEIDDSGLLSANKVTILSVGRLTEQKNFLLTAEAFSGLCSIYPDASYTIIGEGEQHGQIEQIFESHTNMNLRGYLPRNEVFEAIKKASIVVMPSRYEGLSIFMLEAMAFARPFMVSDIDSFRYIFHEKPLKSGETYRICKWGYLVANDNADGYRAAMQHFIDNPQIRTHMANCVAALVREYDMTLTAEKYCKIYDQVCGI